MNLFTGNSTVFAARCLALLPALVLLVGTWSESNAQRTASQPSTNPTVRAHFEAAQEAQKRNDYATAEREYRAVLAAAPHFAEAHMNLGLIYQLQNRIPDATAEFRRALAIKPDLVGANFFLGVDYCNLGQGTKAIPSLKAAAQFVMGQLDVIDYPQGTSDICENQGMFAVTLRVIKELKIAGVSEQISEAYIEQAEAKDRSPGAQHQRCYWFR
jgi:Tfp pilus assembly protein PilF